MGKRGLWFVVWIGCLSLSLLVFLVVMVVIVVNGDDEVRPYDCTFLPVIYGHLDEGMELPGPGSDVPIVSEALCLDVSDLPVTVTPRVTAVPTLDIIMPSVTPGPVVTLMPTSTVTAVTPTVTSVPDGDDCDDEDDGEEDDGEDDDDCDDD